MTPKQQARYLRLVLYFISQRKWKNGCLVDLATEALKRTQDRPKIKSKPERVKSIPKTREAQEATIQSVGCRVEDYKWTGTNYARK